jgi:WhiB family redox-sensing transcriptional regulator
MSPTSKNNEFTTVNWQERAHCKKAAIVIFFPEETHISSPKVYDEGKKICAECPVSTECLAFAMHHERYQWRRFGLFGGKSPKERVNLEQEFPYKDWVSEYLKK